MAESDFSFADFELNAAKRLLLKEGKPVALNSKTFDLLQALIERRGQIVSKDELLEKIWDGQFVEESNLTVQISTLRKLLGEARGENRFVVTVPGKGYKFVGETVEYPGGIEVENHRFSGIEIDQRHLPSESLKLSGNTLSIRYTLRYLLLAAVLILLAGGVYLFLQYNSRSSLPFGKTEIRQLTTTGNVTLAALSPEGKLYAYVTSEFGQQTLMVGRVDGGNDIMLRPAAEAIYHTLAFSPDGGSLYFSVHDYADPDYQLYRMPSFGGVQEKILEKIANFALSPDGKTIGFARRNVTNRRDYILIRELNGTERELTSLPVANELNYDSLSFSPDASLIAYGSSEDENNLKSDISTVQTVNGDVRRLTNHSFASIDKTAWLADGSGLIVDARDTNENGGVPQFQIWRVSLSDGSTTKINTDLSSYEGAIGLSNGVLLTVEHRQMNNIWIAPADDLKQAKQITFGSFGKYEGLWGLDWMPDGRIVFDSSDAHSQVISIMNPDGSGKKKLTAPGQVDSCLSVSNDGRYVVFHSTRGGGINIWRIDLDNGNLTQLTFGKQSYQPAISSDSRFVYYKSLEKGVGELRRVSIDGGESVAVTNKETSWTSVSPDGKYLAALYRTDKPRLSVLPADGGEPIRQFDHVRTALFYVGIRWAPDSKTVVYRDSSYGYWTQSMEGGEAVRMENLPKEKLYNFAWSKDGKQFAFVRGQEISDVVLFRDLK